MSFDRPYANFCQSHLVNRPASVGSGEFLLREFPLSYWMEQQGYDVSYLSNVDTHLDGPRLQRAKGFISVGHDEYWTREMYANAIAARDAGVNLAFLSGNAVYGMVPLLPSAEGQPQRIIRRAGAFVGEPSGTRSGSTYRAGPDGALLMGGRHQGDNVVFNAGTIWWAQGLSSPPGHVLPANKHARPQGPDPRVQRMTANLFDRFVK